MLVHHSSFFVQGPELQQKLIDYDKENADKLKTGDSSGFATYFEEFWNHAYLAPKSSVVSVRLALVLAPSRSCAGEMLKVFALTLSHRE